MPDREKVIAALTLCANGEPCYKDKYKNCLYSPIGKADGYNCGGAMAADALALLREQEPVKPRWIDVTDKLPEVGVICLVAFADEGMTFSSLDKSGKWYVVNGLPQPDYWMPLPEAPSKEVR